MTARGDLDLVLSEWMAGTAHVAEPESLHDGVVARVPSIRQRPSWLAGRAARGFGERGRATARRVSMVGAVAAVTVAGLVWSVMPGAVIPNPSETPAVVTPQSVLPSPMESVPATTPPPRPRVERAERFFLPFDYVIPGGSGLEAVGGDEHLNIIRWVVGAAHGVTVASGEQPAAHGSSSRFAIGGTPADVIEQLRNKGGLELGPITPLELDGMPALAATVEDRDATDIHVGTRSLQNVNYFPLNKPSLLIVSSVDGNVVFITIWARNAQERDAFRPTAMEFVDSIDFVNLPNASPAPTVGESGRFLQPFTYAIPAGSRFVPATGGPRQNAIAWVVGQESQPADASYGGQAPESGVNQGVYVGVSERPWAHGSDGRYFLKTTPAGLLEDLAGPSGLELGPITHVILGGRPGLATSIADYAATDIHLSGGLGGMVGRGLGLTDPNRLIVANVDGKVVLVTVWARTTEELEAFVPAAMELVDSFRFVDTP